MQCLSKNRNDWFNLLEGCWGYAVALHPNLNKIVLGVLLRSTVNTTLIIMNFNFLPETRVGELLRNAQWAHLAITRQT